FQDILGWFGLGRVSTPVALPRGSVLDRAGPRPFDKDLLQEPILAWAGPHPNPLPLGSSLPTSPRGIRAFGRVGGGRRGMMDQARWAATEFGEAELGDARRTVRLVELASGLAERPSASLPEACEDGAQC